MTFLACANYHRQSVRAWDISKHVTLWCSMSPWFDHDGQMRLRAHWYISTRIVGVRVRATLGKCDVAVIATKLHRKETRRRALTDRRRRTAPGRVDG